MDQIQAGLADAAEATSSAVAAQGPITIEGVYIALGLNAVLFLLTFGLAPRFKTSFKEADSWIEIYDRLMAMGGVPGIIPKEAAEKAKRGCVMLCVAVLLRSLQVLCYECQPTASKPRRLAHVFISMA